MIKKVKALLSVMVIIIIGVTVCACNTNVTVTTTPSATVTLEPTPTPMPVQEIIPSRLSIELYVGDALQTQGLFSASFGGFELSVNSDAVSLENGIITALKAGKSILTATGDVTSTTAEIEITVLPLPEKTVSFSAGRFLALKTGETQKLSFTVHPKYLHDVVLTAIGSITLNVSGTIKGDELGFGVVVATIEGEYAGECLVVVNDKENLLPLNAIPAPEYTVQSNTLVRDQNTGDNAVIMLTGDIMCLSAQQNSAKNNGKYDFSPSFKYVKDYFDAADFVIGNLETTLSVTYPYANQEKNVDGMPNCNGQSTLLDALRYAGYDAVVTANNHSLDANELGVYQTLERLEYYKIASTGTFTGRENRFILADINGIKVAFLSYTEIMNKRTAVSTEVYSQIIGEYSKENVARDCAAARNAGAEFIIAYMHWGRENTHEVTSKQQRQAKELANAGVDMIAGSHPHCLQNAETITANDGREVLCIYSLGNFVSSMGRDINNDTVILRLELERTENGVKLKSSGYIPCKVSGYDGKRFVILPCNMLSTTLLKEAENRIDAIFAGNLDKIN